MIELEQSVPGAAFWATYARSESVELKRVNQTVLEYVGYRIWISMAIGGTRLTRLGRRLHAARKGRSATDAPAGSHLHPADQVIIGASRDDIVLGTLALRMDSQGGLRADAHHAQVLDALRREGRRVCELDRPALSLVQDATEIVGALFHMASLYAGEIRAASDLVTEVQQHQVESYRRLLAFTPAGASQRTPGVLLRLELAHTAQRPASLTDDATGIPRRFAFTPEQWRAASGRIQAAIGAASPPISAAAPLQGEARPSSSNGDAPPCTPASIALAVVGPTEAHSFDEGQRAGVRARLRKEPISAYQRVGIDEFARGFRAGYFTGRSRGLPAGEPEAAS